VKQCELLICQVQQKQAKEEEEEEEEEENSKMGSLQRKRMKNRN
jgi:hypothetical protein